MWTSFTSLFLYFLTDTVHLDAAVAGLIVLAGTLWNTMLQPAVGLLSDRTRSASGRRLPYLLYSTVPFGIASWLLFTDFGFRATASTAYFLFVVIVWFTALTAFYVPYGALGSELSTDYDDRTRLSAIRTGFSQVGALVGAVLPLALHDSLSSLTGNERVAWSVSAAICGLLAAAGILVTWMSSRQHVVADVPAQGTLGDILGLFRSRTFRNLLVAYAFGWAPLSVIGAVAIYYAVHIMGYSHTKASATMLVWFASGLLWLPLVRRLCEKTGKVPTFLVFTASWALVQLLFLMPSRDTHVLYWMCIFLSSAGSMAVAVVGWSLLADVTDVEHLRTGRRCEGAMYGAAAFAQTGLAALLLWFVGTVLSVAGYDGGADPGPDALRAIRMLISLGPTVLLIPAVCFAARIRLTRNRHDEIRAALDAPSPPTVDQRATLLSGL